MYIVHISWQGSMSKLTDSLFLCSMWCIPVFVHPEKSSKQFKSFQLLARIDPGGFRATAENLCYLVGVSIVEFG